MNLLILINICIGLLTLSQGMLLYLFLCLVPAQSATTQGALDATTPVAHAQAAREQASVQDEISESTEALPQGGSVLPRVDDAKAPSHRHFHSPLIEPLLRSHTARAPPLAMA